MKKAPDHRSAATKSTRSMWKSALALCCLLLAAGPLHAQDRVALLIANSDYGEGQQLPEAKENVELLA